jgi:uncharacterized protein (TIGR02996 family)
MEDAFRKALAEDPYDLATHLAFADWLDENDRPEEADLQRRWTALKQRESERWLKAFAEEVSSCETILGDRVHPDGFTYEDVIRTGHNYLNEGDKVHVGEQIQVNLNISNHLDEDEAKIFWGHFEVVTGRPVLNHNDEYFVNCSGTC